jgi:N-acetylglucosaminyldiphosphoundecaprenol N-acetyl-beta-D-mannosaminyltransferase
MTTFNKIFLFGIGFTNATKKEILEFIVTGLEKETEKYYIVTPNPELLVIANKDNSYKRILNGAKLALVDGIGILLASKVLGRHLKTRFHGVDLVEMLCEEISKKPITAGFLGAGPNVAVKAVECLQKRHPGLKVGMVSEEWSKDLITKNVDILFVAFGSPKQEIWISENLDKLPAKIVVGVGGAFDFISGEVRRAPLIIRKIGLEWLFRLIIQPWRIKRQLRLIQFIYLVFKEKFSSKNDIIH